MRYRSDGLTDLDTNSLNMRLAEGIGKGTPIPLKYEFFRPVYMVPCWPEQVVMQMAFFYHNQL